jgi:Holliday junction DNA helicase RuvB
MPLIRAEQTTFTVRAMTRFGALAGPFRDRFGIVCRLQYYQPDQLRVIVQKAGERLGVALDTASALEIARRGRGTPRIALKLLKRVRDFSQVKHDGLVNATRVLHALELLAVDHVGLDDGDRRMLILMIEKYRGGPVGLTTLAAALSEDQGTIEEVIEPYLLQIGFLQRTPKGRVVTESAYLHLGLPIDTE